MVSLRLPRVLAQLEFEERVLNVGAVIGMFGVTLPWLSRELEGKDVLFTGFTYFTSMIGTVVFCLFAAIILITAVPLLGGPTLIRRRHEHAARFWLASQATILTAAAFSVLLRATFEFFRTELRFGIYVTLLGCLVSTIYAALQWQQQRRSQIQEFFHHPDEQSPPPMRSSSHVTDAQLPPPPPPPPPLVPEEHHPYRHSIAKR